MLQKVTHRKNFYYISLLEDPLNPYLNSSYYLEIFP